jgi:hypothetical protein
VWLVQRPTWQGAVSTLLAVFSGVFFVLFLHQLPMV